ncbi:MAG: 50S ribosomal protein L25 [Candidatus Omnitrophica bacterium]|jgi:large subunit ribosomal protein L25|nr:50S ribosomal protein L25 [Candidatus Omnitrophota bacterium]
MEEIFLAAQKREEIGRGKVKDIRDAGFIPAVIYAEGKDAQAIKVSHKELFHLLHQHRLENVVIKVKIQDDKVKKDRPCLIKEIQYHPVKGDIVHVDFNEISLTKVIKLNIPLTAKGEPVGVKQEGGSLEHILWEIEIECLPLNIPKHIEVDVTSLKLGDSIHVKDLAVPEGVKILTPMDAIALSCNKPVIEVPVEVEGEEKPELEVIKEKKEVPAAEGQEPEKK